MCAILEQSCFLNKVRYRSPVIINVNCQDLKSELSLHCEHSLRVPRLPNLNDFTSLPANETGAPVQAIGKLTPI